MHARSPAGTRSPCRSRPFHTSARPLELPSEPRGLLAAATAIARRYAGRTKGGVRPPRQGCRAMWRCGCGRRRSSRTATCSADALGGHSLAPTAFRQAPRSWSAFEKTVLILTAGPPTALFQIQAFGVRVCRSRQSDGSGRSSISSRTCRTPSSCPPTRSSWRSRRRRRAQPQPARARRGAVRG
jgi:hypothetical protein